MWSTCLVLTDVKKVLNRHNGYCFNYRNAAGSSEEELLLQLLRTRRKINGTFLKKEMPFNDSAKKKNLHVSNNFNCIEMNFKSIVKF